MLRTPESSCLPKITPERVEDIIDKQLASGVALDTETMRWAFSHCDYAPGDFPHVDFKFCANAFNVLAHSGPTEECIRDANDTYGLTAELIKRELEAYYNDELYDDMSSSHERANEKYSHIGRISELTIFALLSRGIDNGVTVVPLPASRHDDKHNKIDFYLSPVGTGRTDDGWPFQRPLAK